MSGSRAPREPAMASAADSPAALSSLAAKGATRAARPIRCDLTPVELLGRLLDRRRPMLLDSADTSHPDGRYSILCADPIALLRAKEGAAWLELYPEPGDSVGEQAPGRIELGHPLRALAQVQAALRVADPPPLGLPFGGGAVGYFAYDLGRDIERLPSLATDDLAMDDLCLGLYDWALVCDHHGEGFAQTHSAQARSAEPRSAETRSAEPLSAEPGSAQTHSAAPLSAEPRSAQTHSAAPREAAACSWFLVATARRPEERSAEAILDEVSAWLEPRLDATKTTGLPPSPDSRPAPPAAAPPSPSTRAAVTRGFSPKAYVATVRRALEHIFAGDIYQACLTQRFDLPVFEAPFTLYGRLRERTRAMFSAYLDTPTGQVLSLSPERFLRVRGREVETCPIKGTRPRGVTPDEDAALAAELTASAKDLAELSMIVDLERNDLGRVCEAGSVHVASHAELYTLRTVHHTVTRVVGRLREGVDAAALLAATFPGGSITGAPKIRAMEIIEALEPTRRGVYTGAVGYLDFAGDLDLNIAIRTVIAQGQRASVQAGGGIVADSDPQAEHEEALTKARALVEALGAFLEE